MEVTGSWRLNLRSIFGFEFWVLLSHLAARDSLRAMLADVSSLGALHRKGTEANLYHLYSQVFVQEQLERRTFVYYLWQGILSVDSRRTLNVNQIICFCAALNFTELFLASGRLMTKPCHNDACPSLYILLAKLCSSSAPEMESISPPRASGLARDLLWPVEWSEYNICQFLTSRQKTLHTSALLS